MGVKVSAMIVASGIFKDTNNLPFSFPGSSLSSSLVCLSEGVSFRDSSAVVASESFLGVSLSSWPTGELTSATGDCAAAIPAAGGETEWDKATGSMLTSRSCC